MPFLVVVAVLVCGLSCGSDSPPPGDPDAPPIEVDAGCPLPIRLFPDGDGDGFGDASSAGQLFCGDTPGFVTNQDDCADGDADARPTQAEFFPVPVNGPSVRPYDFDCNEIEESRWTAVLPPCATRTPQACETLFNAWASTVGAPDCGERHLWVTGCAWSPGQDLCVTIGSESRTQECR